MFTENDIKVVRAGGPTRVCITEDRTTSSENATVKPGEPVKKGGATTNYVLTLATGDPEVGTDEFVGIARKESTETSTVDGEVEVISIIPIRTLLRGKATTSGNIDTQTELDGVKMDWVCFDDTASSGTNGIFTIDEDEADDPDVHGLCIIDGDINDYTLDVIVHAMATSAAPYY